MSADELFWGAVVSVVVVFGTVFALVVGFSVVSQLVERWRHRRAQFQLMRAQAIHAERLLSNLQSLQWPPPPDINDTAGSLGALTDHRWTHEVERYANNPSDQ